jgi:hypothetical protein
MKNQKHLLKKYINVKKTKSEHFLQIINSEQSKQSEKIMDKF